VGKVQQELGQTAAKTEVTARRFQLASPTTAVMLEVLGWALIFAYVPLAYLTHGFGTSNDGLTLLLAVTFLVPGVVVARHQPGNAVGWILLGVGTLAVFYPFVDVYATFDYHFHHGRLPFGSAAALVAASSWAPEALALPLIILLFPDGRLSRSWRRILWAYLAISTLLLAAVFIGIATEMIGQPISVDANGQLQTAGVPETALAFLQLFSVVAWLVFASRQVGVWRRSTGERRQQLKWPMSGLGVAVICIVVNLLANSLSGRVAAAVSYIAILGLGALPIGIAIGILKYRLYDIDRLISRTLSYAIVTGLVVGVYVGVVTIVTRVLGFSSPVAVASSTLAAVALFNPLRVRIQRVVDRRFNRARYDAEATVADFTARLRDAVDLETVRGELLVVVNRAVEPTHASVWIRKRDASTQPNDP